MIPRFFLATFLTLASFTAPAADGFVSRFNGKNLTDGEVKPSTGVRISDTATKVAGAETSNQQGPGNSSPSGKAK